MLLKELAGEGVLHHKLKSRERGAGWLIIAKKLQPSFPGIEVTAPAVRDHYGVLERKHENKMAQEERATGISGEELTEVEGLLEELIEIYEETERRVEGGNEIKKANVEKEKNQAVEMRQRAMERYRETKK
jgi:hypothetical protein